MRITPSKDEVTGSIFGITRAWFWSLMVIATVFVGVSGYWMAKPYWLGLERKAYVASPQYVEARRAEMMTMHTQVLGINISIARPGTSAQLKASLGVQKAALLARLREAAAKVPADVVPPAVTRLLATN